MWAAQYDDPLYFHWIIIDKELRKAIGTFYIDHVDEEKRTGVVNCILSQRVWGRGLAAEITQAVALYCFRQVNFKKLISHHHEDNAASGKALVKAGFHFTGKSYHIYEESPGINGFYLHYDLDSDGG